MPVWYDRIHLCMIKLRQWVAGLHCDHTIQHQLCKGINPQHRIFKNIYCNSRHPWTRTGWYFRRCQRWVLRSRSRGCTCGHSRWWWRRACWRGSPSATWHTTWCTSTCTTARRSHITSAISRTTISNITMCTNRKVLSLGFRHILAFFLISIIISVLVSIMWEYNQYVQPW